MSSPLINTHHWISLELVIQTLLKEIFKNQIQRSLCKEMLEFHTDSLDDLCIQV